MKGSMNRTIGKVSASPNWRETHRRFNRQCRFESQPATQPGCREPLNHRVYTTVVPRSAYCRSTERALFRSDKRRQHRTLTSSRHPGPGQADLSRSERLRSCRVEKYRPPAIHIAWCYVQKLSVLAEGRGRRPAATMFIWSVCCTIFLVSPDHL